MNLLSPSLSSIQWKRGRNHGAWCSPAGRLSRNFLLVAKHRTVTIRSFRRKENSNHQLSVLYLMIYPKAHEEDYE